MTRLVFVAMAEIVKAIAAGEWTDDKPAWYRNPSGDDDYDRAAWCAEAFIILAKRFNPLFDESRFLQACGLLDKSTSTRARKVKT